MRDWLEEFAVVLDHSRATQVLLFIALIAPMLIIAGGAWAAQSVSFEEPFAQLATPIRQAVFLRYLFAAGVVFVGALGAAAKQYARARKRIFGNS
jgi:hypothetical protein